MVAKKPATKPAGRSRSNEDVQGLAEGLKGWVKLGSKEFGTTL